MLTQKYINDIAFQIVGCAIEVNKNVGPGLLESVYELCLMDELKSKNLKTNSQVRVPVLYKGKDLGGHLIIDLLVEDLVVVELKSVEALQPIFEAQILSYMMLTDKPKGLLINFNTTNIVASTRHFVTDIFSHLPKS